jgi:hypothetical protein
MSGQAVREWSSVVAISKHLLLAQPPKSLAAVEIPGRGGQEDALDARDLQRHLDRRVFGGASLRSAATAARRCCGRRAARRRARRGPICTAAGTLLKSRSRNSRGPWCAKPGELRAGFPAHDRGFLSDRTRYSDDGALVCVRGGRDGGPVAPAARRARGQDTARGAGLPARSFARQQPGASTGSAPGARVVVSRHSAPPGQATFRAPRRVRRSACSEHGGRLPAVPFPQRRGWSTGGEEATEVPCAAPVTAEQRRPAFADGSTASATERTCPM